ncbi:DNA primase [Pyxidicoccus sp. MSG2]|uniref:DNA primase n=1 Tax=Pyxidicoccus sp. MSG2 TaxID=2996790 RepID=UPI00226EC281|nr:DNA primase [Pyxidicoccus sp. MSG2]MCY1023964.1 DNA primase [Pyxidicoccus sp. MSG2]
MLSIPRELLEEVLRRTDLAALVGAHVQLKKSGKALRGLCPFHQEKTGSFTVEGERWRCYGCQANGDAIAFLQKTAGLSFLEATRQLAAAAGVSLPSRNEKPAPVDPLTRALQLAQAHFVESLASPEGAPARDYLASRGLSAETVSRFGIGWAPASWSSLSNRLAKEGLIPAARTLGLAVARKQSGGHYDFLRDRLTFPLRAPSGQLLAFAGRLLGPSDAPKFLCTQESPRFRKSATLFGADVARSAFRLRRTAVLVEGYFDCAVLQHAGVAHTAALCGTALSPEHLELLRASGVEELVLLLDGDAAGSAAVARLAPLLLPSGFVTRVALLPAGDDPDVFVLREGPDALSALLAQASSLSQHFLAHLLPGGPAASFNAKLSARKQLADVLAPLPSGFWKSAFLAEAARHFGVSEDELLPGNPSAR